jgi:hypothetical protein
LLYANAAICIYIMWCLELEILTDPEVFRQQQPDSLLNFIQHEVNNFFHCFRVYVHTIGWNNERTWKT